MQVTYYYVHFVILQFCMFILFTACFWKYYEKNSLLEIVYLHDQRFC